MRKKLNALVALGIVAAADFPPPARAQNAGYKEIWSGYAAITTCRDGQDAYQFGPYVFVCSGYDYPYHYGDVALLAAAYSADGLTLVFGRLCLSGTDVCLNGQVHVATGLRSAREATRDCRDARDRVEQSANHLQQQTARFQRCLQSSGYDDDCGSSFRGIKSDFSAHESYVSDAQDACR